MNRNRCDNIYTRKCRIPHETLSIGTLREKKKEKDGKIKVKKKEAGKNKRKEEGKARTPSGHDISV